MFKLSTVLFVSICLMRGGTLQAQGVRGSVVDSATRAPLAGVLVELRERDATVAAVYSDSSGAFMVRASRPGRYRVAARKLGFDPVVTVEFDLADGQERPLPLSLSRSLTRLDTIISRANRTTLFGVTPGQAWYLQHLKEGKGEFISPVEILISRRNACDYIAAIPGLTFTVESKVDRGPLCLVNHRIITTSQKGACLITMVDRIGPITGIDSLSFFVRPIRRRTDPTDTLSIEIPFEALRGFEIYRSRDEMPRDNSTVGAWRDTAKLEDIKRCGFLQVWTEIAW